MIAKIKCNCVTAQCNDCKRRDCPMSSKYDADLVQEARADKIRTRGLLE